MAVEGGGIGARLRAGREKLGLTVLQASERLHTDPKILEALEGDDLVALGAPVYARGHLRHYAELVGESYSELNEIYSAATGPAQPDLTRIVKAPAPEHSSKLLVPAVLALSVFAVAGAVWWLLSLSGKRPTASPMTLEAPAGGSPDAGNADAAGSAASSAVGAGSHTGTGSAGGGGSGSGTSSGTGTGSGSAQPRTAASGVRLTPAPGTRLASASPVASTAAGSANSGAAGASAALGAPGAATPPAPASPGEVPARSGREAQVTLHYSADSWTEVYDASGARLFYDVGSANSVRTLKGTAPLRIVVANAAGVAVEVNGRSAPIDKMSHADGSAQFIVSRSGRVTRAPSTADGG
ncbi:MAG TPA: RodZ domain-containing protein [Steroidobacteraceae bacterium]|nr:RodZ domain-containing protein [Steroidobacteraceae bacterium]